MVLLRPGQGFKKFIVKKKTTTLTSSGKPISSGYKEMGTIIGILATASQKEIEQWKQNGHPITHTIVQQGVKNSANATDYLILAESSKKDRYFYIQGAVNPGELNHIMRYFVEERKDLTNG